MLAQPAEDRIPRTGSLSLLLSRNAANREKDRTFARFVSVSDVFNRGAEEAATVLTLMVVVGVNASIAPTKSLISVSLSDDRGMSPVVQ
jgi:hypothetical protein